MEVHVPNVYLSITQASQQELVDRINSNRVYLFDILGADSEVRRSQSYERKITFLLLLGGLI